MFVLLAVNFKAVVHFLWNTQKKMLCSMVNFCFDSSRTRQRAQSRVRQQLFFMCSPIPLLPVMFHGLYDEDRENTTRRLLLYMILPYLRLEHRPLTTSVLHRVLSWANLPKVAQVWPQFLIWDSTPVLQEFLGRPLFLLPWGFQRSACRVMLLAGFLRM